MREDQRGLRSGREMTDGGPAFPTEQEGMRLLGGMSLRDWLAGQALAILGHAGAAYNIRPGTTDAEAVAIASYLVADAMLAARKTCPPDQCYHPVPREECRYCEEVAEPKPETIPEPEECPGCEAYAAMLGPWEHAETPWDEMPSISGNHAGPSFDSPGGVLDFFIVLGFFTPAEARELAHRLLRWLREPVNK